MTRKSLCMAAAAVALLCGSSAIAQTSGSSGQSGSMGEQGTSSQQPGGSSSGSMGQGGMSGSQDQGSMGSGSQGQGSMGGSASQGQSGMEQGSQGMSGQSAMQGSSGQQSEMFAAFDQNKDGSLDRLEFSRAIQVQGSTPAAGGGQGGLPSGSTPRGDRAISPLNQTSADFQRADTNGDGKVSQDEFSSFSPQQQQQQQ